MIPQAQVIQNACPEEAFKCSKEDAAHQQTRIIRGDALQHACDAPEAHAESDPFRRWEDSVANAAWHLKENQADLDGILVRQWVKWIQEVQTHIEDHDHHLPLACVELPGTWSNSAVLRLVALV